jgi:hypothetical protein
MSDNLKHILKEFEELKGQFVITLDWKIERLVSIGDDEFDYYWITYNGRELHWNSCVRRIMPLKGYLRDEDYHELIRLAKLNHYDQIDKNDKFFKDYISKLSKKDKFLTPFCWDLN